MVGSESVRFGVSLRDRSAAGTALPMRVVRASAREITPPSLGSLYPELPLNFNDEGQEGDALGADGVYSVRLQPQAQGFAGLFGQIRVDALLEYRGEQDLVHFDILYTPEAPAVWLGPVHEALEGGSLSLVLKARVREAGRYIVSARVDDAKGQPLALLSFNDEVAEGEQEFRLTLFGKLVRDARPAFPLTVRDVNGFLLHPDTFPDRSLMSGLEGTVHQTQDYPLTSFDAAEWRSEERTRYLVELGHDVSDAKAQLDRLGSRP